MSRLSDTRQRTRETAAQLIAAGRRPHALTVDLIYAEIKQGSRTTINDELKLWKDEQTKIDALKDVLPPMVANAMMTVWAAAVEHGEKVFDQRREETENELASVQQHAQNLSGELATRRDEIGTLNGQLTTRDAEVGGLQRELASAHATLQAAQARTLALEQQQEMNRVEAERKFETAAMNHQRRADELQHALETQEQNYRAEIGKATERLEGVQNHVMLHVSEAREATKRVEGLLEKANQRNVVLLTETEKLKPLLAAEYQSHDRVKEHWERAAYDQSSLKLERDQLSQQLATMTGKLDAQTRVGLDSNGIRRFLT